MQNDLKKFLVSAGLSSSMVNQILNSPRISLPAGAMEISSPKVGWQKLNEASLVVLLGVENFSLLNQPNCEFRGKTVFWVEPEPGYLKEFLVQNRHLPEIEEFELIIVAGHKTDQLAEILEEYLGLAYESSIEILTPSEERLDQFNAAVHGLDRFFDIAEKNRATIDRFLTDWQLNFADNIDDYLTGRNINSLEGILRGRGCTLVGPGPALDNNLALLKKYSVNCLVALDTALPILKKLQLKPDFVVAIDSGKSNEKFFNQNDYNDIRLVCPPYMTSEIVRSFGERYYFQPNFPPAVWFEEILQQSGRLAVSGSVAVTAVDFIRTLDPDYLVVLGIDLAYQERRAYSKFSYHDENFLGQLNRVNTMAGLNYQKINENKLEIIRTEQGNIVSSDIFQSWKNVLDFLFETADFEIFRPARAGLPLANTKALERSTDLPADRTKIRPLPSREKNRWKPGAKEKLNRLYWDIIEIKARLKLVNSLIRSNRPVSLEFMELLKLISKKDNFVQYFWWEVERLFRRFRELVDRENSGCPAELLVDFTRTVEKTETALKRLIKKQTGR